MKTKNKALLLALCAVSLVTASVLGTMAYLTDNKKVTNTFTVGSVAITMDETDVNTDGTPVEGENVDRVTANEYKLLPGHTYVKDPQIHVAPTSEDCYLFVKVENGIAAIESKDAGKSVDAQMVANGWTKVEGQTNVYVKMNGNALQIVKGGETVNVFETLTIDGATVDKTKLEQYKNATITVTAYAVQKDGFEGKSAADIWKDAGFTN